MSDETSPCRREGYEALWLWFGLSRASFLTLPRVLLHEMPDEWQGKMATLLNEWEDAFPNFPDIHLTVNGRQKGKLIRLPEWMINYRYPNIDIINSFRKKP